MTKKCTVIIAADSLDSKPEIKTFDFLYEAQDYASERVSQSVQWRVDHSPYTISEEELDEMYEEEWALVNFVEN